MPMRDVSWPPVPSGFLPRLIDRKAGNDLICLGCDKDVKVADRPAALDTRESQTRVAALRDARNSLIESISRKADALHVARSSSVDVEQFTGVNGLFVYLERDPGAQ
jgi:hypothetical protein